MVWRWCYSETGHRVESLWCFCPHDDTTLVHREEYDRVSFECETCHRRFGPLPGDRIQAISMIIRQIDRKLRTGEWIAEFRRGLGTNS